VISPTDLVYAIGECAFNVIVWRVAFRRGFSKGETAPTAFQKTEVCQCRHGVSHHDAKGCNYAKRGKPVGWTRTYSSSGGTEDVPSKWDQELCPCVKYVGPNSSYVPELEATK
jgi:hypothetical protein